MMGWLRLRKTPPPPAAVQVLVAGLPDLGKDAWLSVRFQEGRAAVRAHAVGRYGEGRTVSVWVDVPADRVQQAGLPEVCQRLLASMTDQLQTLALLTTTEAAAVAARQQEA